MSGTTWDLGQSGRKNTFRVYRVDPFSLEEYGPPLAIHEDLGSITYDKTSDNLYSATLNFLEPVSRDYLIRVKQDISLPGNRNIQYTYGTFFIEKCPETHLYGHPTYKASCYSTMLRYTKDVLVGPLYWGPGYKVVDAIRETVAVDGSYFQVLPGNNMERTFSVPVYFPDNYKVSDMLTEMAYWINCEIYPDEYGNIVLAPYQNATEKPISYQFEVNSTTCICEAGYSLEDVQSDAYNRWKVYYSTSEGSGLAQAMLPSTHPYSYHRIGRWVTYSEQIQNPCSEEELQALANRRMAENSINDKYLQIRCAFHPDVGIGDTVRYVNATDGPEPISHICEVVQLDVELNISNMCTVKLRILS